MAEQQSVVSTEPKPVKKRAKRGPGRPKGAKRGPGRPKGRRGRPKASAAKKGLVSAIVEKAVKKLLKAERTMVADQVKSLVAKEVKKALKAAFK